MPSSEAIRAAVEVINELKDMGFDYSMHKTRIVKAFDENLLNGDNEATVVVHSSVLKDLRIIQEDHYDQHMDEDDKPLWDEMLFDVCNVPSYVWFV